MKPREHRRERLTSFGVEDRPDELKDIRGATFRKVFVLPSFDNRSLAAIVEYEVGGPGDLDKRFRYYILNGKSVGGSCYYPTFLVKHSLSFDGTKFAVAIPVYDDDDELYYQIMINGEPTYEVKLKTLAHMQWISNDELAWRGWNQDPDGRISEGIKSFVNGEEVTGQIEFESCYQRRGVPRVKVCRGNEYFLINEDGSVRDQWTVVDGEDEALHRYPRRNPNHDKPVDTAPHNRSGRGIRLEYRGVTGPRFDKVHSVDHRMHTYSYNPDRSMVGYVGKRFPFYAGALDTIGTFVAVLVFHVPPNLHGDPPGGRYHPVSNGREWRRSYRYVADHIYTPNDEFVVVAHASHGQRVVIEEAEGPLFDEVYHLRYFDDEGCICYIGRLGDDYYRVTVTA